MSTVLKDIKPQKSLPAPNSDFYELAETLPAEELAVMKQVRAFMEAKVAPIITKYWVDDAFPFELLPAIKELNIGGVAMNGYGCRGGSALLFGLIAMEMARFDASIATFFGVHNGLAMGSIYLGGSEEQKQKWLPPMARWEKIGCFGLTEPLVGQLPGAGREPPAGRQIISRHRPCIEDDALPGWVGGYGMCDGRLRERTQVLPGAFAVRQADRLVPTRAGPARQNARQYHCFAVPDSPNGTTAG